MKELTEFAPAGAIVAALAWGGMSYFISGPEAATRIAHAHYIEPCESTLVATIEEQALLEERQINQSTIVEDQTSAANSQWNRMQGQYPEHTMLLDMITGGGFSQTIEIQNEQARRVRQAREDARAAIRARAARAAESAPDQCSCQVQAALNETRTSWALFAGSFGLIEQEGVTSFSSIMRANATYCAGRVAS